MDLRSYPTAHPQVADRIIDGAAVIILADAGRVNVLNEVGTRIWGLAADSLSAQEIVESIAAEYAVRPEQARQDVIEFLQTLIEAGAITLEERGE